MDIISTIQEDLKQKILTCLPIKEAGRTAILSSNWRNTWKSIPDLVIREDFGFVKNNGGCNNVDINSHEFMSDGDVMSDDDDFVDNDDFINNYDGVIRVDYGVYEDEEPDKITNMVDAILFLHEGPIRKFDLCTKADCRDNLDRWVNNLSENGIMQLKLNLGGFNVINKMPSNFFSCHSLDYICLYNFELKLPDEFHGFPLVKTLELTGIHSSRDCMEKLVSSCPVLENLVLICYKRSDLVKINAPNLINLDICGELFVYKIWAPKLLSLCVDMFMLASPILGDMPNLNQLLGGVPNIECLNLGSYYLNFLARLHILEKFPLVFQNLKEISFDLDFDLLNDAKFVITLLQNAPNLQVLNVKMFYTTYSQKPTKNMWDTQNFSLECLEILNFTNEYLNFTNECCINDNSLPFLKFVLTSSPKLVKVQVHNHRCKTNSKTCLKDLLMFPRASTQVQIFDD